MNGPVEVAFTVYEVKEVIKFSLRLRYSFLRHNNSLEIALLFIPNLFRGHLTWSLASNYSVLIIFLSSAKIVITLELWFPLFQDFAHYKSGVYSHITGDEMGGHAVKLIGWGTSDDGVDYWVIKLLSFLKTFLFDVNCWTLHLLLVCPRSSWPISGIEAGVMYVSRRTLNFVNDSRWFLFICTMW